MSNETKAAVISWLREARNERQALVRQLQARIESGNVVIAGLNGADEGLTEWLRRGLSERAHLVQLLQQRIQGADQVIAQLEGESGGGVQLSPSRN